MLIEMCIHQKYIQLVGH